MKTLFKVKVKSLSRVRLWATPWTAAYQAPLPMGFSRQEYGSGVPLPSLTLLLLLLKESILLSMYITQRVKFKRPQLIWLAPSPLSSCLWFQQWTLEIMVTGRLSGTKWMHALLIKCGDSDSMFLLEKTWIWMNFCQWLRSNICKCQEPHLFLFTRSISYVQQTNSKDASQSLFLIAINQHLLFPSSFSFSK